MLSFLASAPCGCDLLNIWPLHAQLHEPLQEASRIRQGHACSSLCVVIAPIGFIYLVSLLLSPWRTRCKPPPFPPSSVLPQFVCQDLGESQGRKEVAWGRIPQKGGSVGTHAAHWKVSPHSGQASSAITVLNVISLWKHLHCLHMHGSRIQNLSSISQTSQQISFHRHGK